MSLSNDEECEYICLIALAYELRNDARRLSMAVIESLTVPIMVLMLSNCALSVSISLPCVAMSASIERSEFSCRDIFLLVLSIWVEVCLISFCFCSFCLRTLPMSEFCAAAENAAMAAVKNNMTSGLKFISLKVGYGCFTNRYLVALSACRHRCICIYDLLKDCR